MVFQILAEKHENVSKLHSGNYARKKHTKVTLEFAIELLRELADDEGELSIYDLAYFRMEEMESYIKTCLK